MKAAYWIFIIIFIIIIAIAIMIYLWYSEAVSSSYLWVIGVTFVLLIIIFAMWYALGTATVPVASPPPVVTQMTTPQNTFITQPDSWQDTGPQHQTVNHFHINHSAPQTIDNSDPPVIIPQTRQPNVMSMNVNSTPAPGVVRQTTYHQNNGIPTEHIRHEYDRGATFDEDPKTVVRTIPGRTQYNAQVLHSNLGYTTGTLRHNGKVVVDRTDTGEHPVNIR